MFKVSSILVCPKYLATTVILAPLLTSRDAHECWKSWILICGTSANLQLRFYLDFNSINDVIDKSKITSFRKKIQCFRHASEESVNERKIYFEVEKINS